jgi:hypothetical protein
MYQLKIQVRSAPYAAGQGPEPIDSLAKNDAQEASAMQHESRQNKRSKWGGAPQHDGEASAVARACRFLFFPCADAVLSARRRGGVIALLMQRSGARGKARATAPALPHKGGRRQAVMVNRCRSLLAARFAPGSGTASDRSENEYCVPSQVSRRLGPCLILNQLPRRCPAPAAARSKYRCTASTCAALWIGTRLANPVPSPASP